MITIYQAVQAAKANVRCFSPNVEFEPKTDVVFKGDHYVIWLQELGSDIKERVYVCAETGGVLHDIWFEEVML